MKKQLLILITSVFCIGLGSLFCPKKPVNPTIKKVSPSKVAETKSYFLQRLNQEEEALHEKISREFAVDAKYLKTNFCQQWQQKPSKPQTDEHIYKLIFDVAQEYNFNADRLTISVNNNDAASPAYSTSSGLIIEMNLFKLMPETVQRFIVAHELQHILNNDTDSISIIKRSLGNKPMTAAQSKLFELYNKFQEKRADFNAALQGEQWAQGYLAFAKEGLKRCTSGAGNMHPSWSERAQWAEEMVNHMHGIKNV